MASADAGSHVVEEADPRVMWKHNDVVKTEQSSGFNVTLSTVAYVCDFTDGRG